MTQNTNSHFVGTYVKDMTLVMAASMLSRQNAIFLGAPGFGKTRIAEAMARHLAQPYSLVRIDPSTPVEVLRGPYDPAAMLNGRLERVVDGTPYADDVAVAILDELFRGNRALFDAALDVTDRVDRQDAPPVWATSNFVVNDDRVQALIDRFALWLWVNPGPLDVQAITAAQLNSGGRPSLDTAGLPTWQDIERVRAMQPGPNAIKAVAELIQQMTDGAAKEGLTVHPRRVTQWANVLFRVSAWLTDDPDFTTVPAEASRMLRYCHPAITPEEAATWHEIAAEVVDTVGAAIEQVMANVLAEMQKLTGKSGRDMPALVAGLTNVMQNAQTTLTKVGGDDPRVEEAIGQMNKWLALGVQGKPIE